MESPPNFEQEIQMHHGNPHMNPIMPQQQMQHPNRMHQSMMDNNDRMQHQHMMHGQGHSGGMSGQYNSMNGMVNRGPPHMNLQKPDPKKNGRKPTPNEKKPNQPKSPAVKRPKEIIYVKLFGVQ
jgi:hypothetical protein